MSLINVSNLTFGYDGSYENIFENVSFQIDTNWKLGFTGRNGRGKTTFLNLLMENLEYKGKITASVVFEYFPYKVEDKNNLTIYILEEIYPDYEYWKLKKEMNFMELNEDILYRFFNTLSNGEQIKILLIILFLKENSFLLIDEPTNHLDMSARKLVSEYLNKKTGFIIVSYDRAFLDGCVDHILSINKTNIEIQKGNFSSWLANKEYNDKFELAENQKLKKEIKRLNDTMKEKALWSEKAERRKRGIDPLKVDVKFGYAPNQAAKSKKMMSRAKAIEERTKSTISEKSKLLKNIEDNPELEIRPLLFHSKRIAECKNLSILYNKKKILDDLSFSIERGDRISLCGKNGSGKSSIIKLICGDEISYMGELYIAKGIKISYLPQDTSHLSGKLSEYEMKKGLDIKVFRAILRKLDFSKSMFEKDIAALSQGQKKKVMLAESLCTPAHLYIWDEPLNYIDVISRIQIENVIKEYKPTLLFVEHDRAFCKNIATKQIEI